LGAPAESWAWTHTEKASNVAVQIELSNVFIISTFFQICFSTSLNQRMNWAIQDKVFQVQNEVIIFVGRGAQRGQAGAPHEIVRHPRPGVRLS
jgi:hypothetical protein